MSKTPKFSIVIPIHDMRGGPTFLWKAINSVLSQTFKDYEIVITKDGKMAENSNSGIRRARGEYIKMLYMDDYLSHSVALELMLEKIKGKEWLICGTHNNPDPVWTSDVELGNNKLGSPSALMFKNHFDKNILFDEEMSWLLDCDLYKRMEHRYGQPQILPGRHVVLEEGEHQMTFILSREEKLAEHNYMKNKYGH